LYSSVLNSLQFIQWEPRDTCGEADGQRGRRMGTTNINRRFWRLCERS